MGHHLSPWGDGATCPIRRRFGRMNPTKLEESESTGAFLAAAAEETVLGDVQAAVNVVQDAGKSDLAATLKQLAEVVAEAQGIGEPERREAVELVAAVGEEASKSEPRNSALRASGTSLWGIVKVAGETGVAYEAMKLALRAAIGVELP